MRKEKLLQIVSLFMIELMILLPVYVAAQMAPNATTNATAPSATITASAPLWANKNKVDITGTAMPGAKLEYYIGPTKVKISRARPDGSFVTTNVPLIKKDKNIITVKAIKDSTTAETTVEVNLDTKPPVLNISEVPELTTQRSISINGDVDEEVRLYYTSYAVKDDVPPGDITGLEARQVLQNQVIILWNPVSDADFLEYAVYRDNTRIGTTRSATYTDTTVASGKTYKYRVSAVDDSCNEGPKSPSISVKTEEGGSANQTTTAAALTCKPQYKHIDTFMPFDLQFDLAPVGKTVIELIAEDKARNKHEITKEVKFDAGPPQFISTNLDQIGLTYIPEVTIKGNLSEQATVFVYKDGKATEYFEVTDENGYFEIPIQLTSEVEVDTEQAALNTGIGWSNKISLKAVDLADQESWYPGPTQNVEIVWAECGFGNWMKIDMENVIPSIISPRLVLQGIQQIGIPFKMEYVGGQEKVQLRQVNIVPVRLSPDLEEWFDNNKIQAPQVFVSPVNPNDPNNKEWVGFAQINFANFPLDELDLESDATDVDKEMAISEWRRGEVIPKGGVHERGYWFVPGCPGAFGCMRFYFEVDIPFTEERQYTDPQGVIRKEVIQRRQRECLPLTIEIDQTIPPDVIPEGMLQSASDFLNDTIELIDALLDPLTQVSQFLLYSCASSMALLLLSKFGENLGCTGLGETDKEIAEIGLCTEVYEGAEDQGKCERCQWFIRAYKDLQETVYRPICDRVGCPNAPTLQKYIKDSRRDAKDITALLNKDKAQKNKEKVLEEYGVEGKLYMGSSCAFSDLNTKENLRFISLGYTAASKKDLDEAVLRKPIATGAEKEQEDLNRNLLVTDINTGTAVEGPEQKIPNIPMNHITGAAVASAEANGVGAGGGTPQSYPKPERLGIKELYKIYSEKAEDEDYKWCKNTLHAAHPKCCGFEYMDEWNSACGIGRLAGRIVTLGMDLDSFNEIKHSAELAAQRAGRAGEISTFSNIFNFMSGLCSSKGDPKPELVQTELSFDPPKSHAEQNRVYMVVNPKESSGKEDDFLYEVYAAYIGKDYEISAMGADERKEKGINEKDIFVLSKGTLDIVRLEDFTSYFSAIGTDKEKAKKTQFIGTFCTKIKAKGVKKCSKSDAENIYNKVLEYIGTTDQEYIVKPASGLWTSIRCHCLPAVVGYLELWRGIVLEVKYCFDTILTTGDYDSGICKAVLAKYVCDLLWEIITCFVKVWNKPGGLRAKTGFVGDFFGALTGAGTDIAGDVKGRYGETSTFNAIFNEQELVHGLCFMAFGLDYDLNINALTRTTIEATATDPPPVLFEVCERRFIGFNPQTNPKGLTTWEYHFGILAMAAQESNVRLELICSTGYECDASEGFTGGECDCNKKGSEAKVSISPTSQACPGWTNRLTRGEMLNVDCYHNQQSNYRFDKAKLTIEWQDKNTNQRDKIEKECEINQIGAPPPFFCRFDAFSVSFRCKFGEDPSGLKIEKLEPAYKKQVDSTPVFGVGERMAFDFEIKQMLPEDPSERDKGTKFLTYVIKNSKNQNVSSASPGTGKVSSKDFELKSEGFYTKRVEMDVITESMFTSKGATGAKPYDIDAWGKRTGLTGALKLGGYISDVEFKYFKDDKPQTRIPAAAKFIIDIKDGNFKVYKSQGPVRQADKMWLFDANDPAEPNIEKEFKAGAYSYVYRKGNERYELKFKILKMGVLKSSDRAQFLLSYQRAAAATLPCESKKPVTWTAEFKVLNADKYGQATEQVAVDPSTGQSQQKTVSFQVVCKEASGLAEKGVKLAEPSKTGIHAVLLGDTTLTPGVLTSAPVGTHRFKVITAADINKVTMKIGDEEAKELEKYETGGFRSEESGLKVGDALNFTITTFKEGKKTGSGDYSVKIEEAVEKAVDKEKGAEEPEEEEKDETAAEEEPNPRILNVTVSGLGIFSKDTLKRDTTLNKKIPIAHAKSGRNIVLEVHTTSNATKVTINDKEMTSQIKEKEKIFKYYLYITAEYDVIQRFNITVYKDQKQTDSELYMIKINKELTHLGG